MRKAFVRLLEVTLAFIVLFMFLNNVRIYSPPRYADVENIQRLFRIADDAAIGLCNNENFRHDFVEGLMPDNLTRRIDAWNKGESNKQYDSTDNTTMTIRQITLFNESNNRIRICLETVGTAVTANASICERENGPNCTAGTLSGAYEIPTGTGWQCSEWFNYSINMSKEYLVNVYFPDSDYYYYYIATQNGFYYKLNVDDTLSETVTGYIDETTTAVFSVRVEAFHDYGFNETMPKGIGYHVWLYSNNTNDSRLDDLLNDSGKDLVNNTIITSSCLIYGYNNTYSPRKIIVGVWNEW